MNSIARMIHLERLADDNLNRGIQRRRAMKKTKATQGKKIAIQIRDVDFKYVSNGGDAERAARRIDAAIRRAVRKAESGAEAWCVDWLCDRGCPAWAQDMDKAFAKRKKL